MPLVTNTVVEAINGEPTQVQRLEVDIVVDARTPQVYRLSTGDQVRGHDSIDFDPAVDSWSIELPPTDDLTPTGLIRIRQWFAATTPRRTRGDSEALIAVPDGPGPYRLADLLAADPGTRTPVVVGFTPAGDWDESRTYFLRQVVAHFGSSYVARGTVTGVEPGTDSELWQLVAASGSGEGVVVPDATTTVKGKTVLMGGTAANPTVPWSRVTGAPGALPPSGGAGGVLSGTFPNPGFAVDMATQAELNAHVASASPHPQYDDLPSLTLLFQNGLV